MIPADSLSPEAMWLIIGIGIGLLIWWARDVIVEARAQWEREQPQLMDARQDSPPLYDQEESAS